MTSPQPVLKLVFFGTGSFAVPALEALAQHVCLVVTQPDKPSGRSARPQPTACKIAALSLGLPVETPERSRSLEFLELLRGMQADALVVASYGQILSEKVLASAKYGGINLHGSILPRYRGAAPIQRAILNGETETGVTLMQMDKGMDTGDIIDIRRLRVDPDETYGELQERLAGIAARQAKEWLPKIVAGLYPRTTQEDSLATTAPKVERSEAEMYFDRSAQAEYDRFRAFTPNPGAWIRTGHGVLKIWRAARSGNTLAPGTVGAVSPALSVGFAGGSIDFLEVQPEGKKRMSGRDYANGARLRPGACLI